MKPSRTSIIMPTLLAILGLGQWRADAQVIDPFYADAYQLTDLGSVPAGPSSLGGFGFTFEDVNRMVIGGSAESVNSKIFSVHVARDVDGHIISFGCSPAAFFANATDGVCGIDGGLQYGPGNVLFFALYPEN